MMLIGGRLRIGWLQKRESMCGQQLHVDLMFDSRGDIGCVIIRGEVEIDGGVSASERKQMAGT